MRLFAWDGLCAVNNSWPQFGRGGLEGNPIPFGCGESRSTRFLGGLRYCHLRKVCSSVFCAASRESGGSCSRSAEKCARPGVEMTRSPIFGGARARIPPNEGFLGEVSLAGSESAVQLSFVASCWPPSTPRTRDDHSAVRIISVRMRRRPGCFDMITDTEGSWFGSAWIRLPQVRYKAAVKRPSTVQRISRRQRD